MARAAERRRETDKFRLDRSISWGDIGMFLGAVVTILVVTVKLQAEVEHHGKELSVIDQRVSGVAERVRTVEGTVIAQERTNTEKRNELRQEIKSDLGQINSKLDRLIERELNGAHRN